MLSSVVNEVCRNSVTRGSFHGVVLNVVVLSAPTFADQDNLPQTMAFILETYRWRPVSAGGAIA
jgi:hypothetical protein